MGEPKTTTKEWVDKARAVHGNAYDYSKTIYRGSKEVIVITCKQHGDFFQRAVNHLAGYGCHQCAKEKLSKSTKAAWNSPDYQEKLGKNRKPVGKIAVTCSCGATGSITHGALLKAKRKHGEWKCHLCSVTSEITTTDWVERARKVHGRVYEYSQSRYSKGENKVTIICAAHGPFDQIASNHLMGTGCPKCAQEDLKKRLKERWTPEFTEKMRVIQKSPEYRKAIMACWNDPEYRNKMAVIRAKMPRYSSLNKTVETYLQELGIEYLPEHVIGPYSFDFFIKSHSLLIECNGEYWHSLPRAQRNDKSKVTYIEQYFPEFRLLTIWEIEFYKEGKIKDLLRKELGLVERPAIVIDFDNLSISEITSKQAREFCSLHHYLGSVRGNQYYGLFYQGELIGCCTFGPFSRNEQTEKYKGAVELTRFCINPNHQVKNIGSWFLSRCLKLIKRSVITYADTTVGHDGALYKATNFKFLHTVPADYYYVDSNNWVIHKRTIWGRAKKMLITEAEYAAKHGLSKKFSGEKLCFGFGVPDA